MATPLPPEFAPYARAIGLRIEQERTGQAMTKEELAERSGLASRYLWRVEAGLQNVTFKNLLAIAQGLQVTLATLTQDVERLADNPPPTAKKTRGRAPAKVRTDS